MRGFELRAAGEISLLSSFTYFIVYLLYLFDEAEFGFKVLELIFLD